MPSKGVSSSPSGNAVVDGLLMGQAWSGSEVTFGFRYGDINNNGINDFDEGDWKSFYRELTANVESFADLKLREVSEQGNINFKLWLGGGGESGTPDLGVTDLDSVVGIARDVAASAEVVRLGTHSVYWFHEFGHALGLKHPHDEMEGPYAKLPGIKHEGDQGTTFLNSELTTSMTYTWSFLPEDNPFTAAYDPGTRVEAQPGSFGAIDIAALQHLYGARAHNTGNDTYRFSDDVDFNHGYTTIWDTGGSDTIEYVGISRAKIDLRAATLENEIGGGGWISTSEPLHGGYSIAHGVLIENATGNRADDILIGNEAANTLTGLGGRDVLRGNAGNDRLDGGAGNDTLDGGEGIDSAIYHGAFKNYSLRLEGAVTVVTGEGVDRLQNVEHAIFADGVYDLGQRVFRPNGTTAPVPIQTGTAGGDTLTATSGAAWTLSGGAGDDILIGSTGNDRLDGGSGNDRLDGGTGADTMIGGSGDDTYVVDNKGDVVIEGANSGYDSVESSISYTLGAWVQDLSLTGFAALTGTGNELDNTLTGNDASNVLSGGAGNDRLDGRGGRDQMMGGLGDDRYVVDNAGDVVTERAGEGTDHVESAISYTLGANVENLSFTGTQALDGTGNALSNILVGNQAANVLDGKEGDDILTGGGGNDRLIGDGGDDRLIGDAGDDQLTGGDGDDQLTGGSGDDHLIGDAGDDQLTGGDGDDQLTGGSGDDHLIGGDGNDRLHGGAGVDVLTGGAGRDIFVFLEGDTGSISGRADSILDFQADDVINLHDLAYWDPNLLHLVGKEEFSKTAGEIRFTQSSGATLIEGDVGGDGQADFAIMLAGNHDLTARNFDFDFLF